MKSLIFPQESHSNEKSLPKTGSKQKAPENTIGEEKEGDRGQQIRLRDIEGIT